MKTSSVQQAQKFLFHGAFGLLLGILLCAVGYASFGSWICIVAAVFAALGLHRFGRLGPDESHLS